MIGASIANLWFSKRFYDDFKALAIEVARKVTSAYSVIMSSGPFHPSFKTRKIKKNRDCRIRLMNVDDDYRMVVALEGHHAFFEMVGPLAVMSSIPSFRYQISFGLAKG